MFVLLCRYSGPLLDEEQFSAAVDSAAVTRDFSLLVEWIITELAAVAKLEEHVHSVNSMYITSHTLVPKKHLAKFVVKFNLLARSLADATATPKATTTQWNTISKS